MLVKWYAVGEPLAARLVFWIYFLTSAGLLFVVQSRLESSERQQLPAGVSRSSRSRRLRRQPASGSASTCPCCSRCPTRCRGGPPAGSCGHSGQHTCGGRDCGRHRLCAEALFPRCSSARRGNAGSSTRLEVDLSGRVARHRHYDPRLCPADRGPGAAVPVVHDSADEGHLLGLRLDQLPCPLQSIPGRCGAVRLWSGDRTTGQMLDAATLRHVAGRSRLLVQLFHSGQGIRVPRFSGTDLCDRIPWHFDCIRPQPRAQRTAKPFAAAVSVSYRGHAPADAASDQARVQFHGRLVRPVQHDMGQYRTLS